MGLPHPQRELLVVSLKNLSPTSKRSSLCIFEFFTLSSPTLNESFSLYLEKFVTPLKEKFSLSISIFHSLLPHPHQEVLFVSLTTSSTSTPHLKEKFSLHI